MPWSMADTTYDYTQQGQAWSSQYVRNSSYRVTPDQESRIMSALVVDDPSTPMSTFRQTVARVPEVVRNSLTQPTIDDVLGGVAGQAPQQTFSDFSGTAAGIEASPRNTISTGNSGGA
jgi:hypothetical protein